MASVDRIDAISAASVISNIKSCTKPQLLHFLCSLREDDIKYLCLNLLLRRRPELKNNAFLNWNYSEYDLNTYINYLIYYFTFSQNASTQNNKSLFLELPSDINAYIMSFSNMRDRLSYELVSKDFYKFCQIPMAKSHLIIDHKFVVGLSNNSFDYRKYCNTQYIEIKYVFENSTASLSKYGDLEQQYYSVIASILTSSPSLKTIEYNLDGKKFQSNLKHIGYGYPGHFLQWIQSIKNNKFYSKNSMKNVTKLIWTPSQHDRNGVHWFGSLFFDMSTEWWMKHTLFLKYLPNLNCIKIPNIKLYSHMGTCDKDAVWFLFKAPYYYNCIQNLDISLFHRKQKIYDIDRRKQINIYNHPLYHFYKFTNLQCLTLKLPIFEECNVYYQQLWTEQLAQKSMKFKCLKVRIISLEFDVSEISGFTGRNNNNRNNDNVNDEHIINEICKYILPICPNLSHYTLITNGMSINAGLDAYNHLIGFYDRLESLDIDSSSKSILSEKMRFISLKKFTLRLYNDENLNNCIKNELNNLFPKLESFEIIYINKPSKKYAKLNINIINFINYLMNANYMKKLKYIGISHKVCNDNKKQIMQKGKCFDLQSSEHYNAASSMKICKAIIELAVKYTRNIESIYFNPIALKTKELEYLSFWFNGEFGHFESDIYRPYRRSITLCHLRCSSQPQKT